MVCTDTLAVFLFLFIIILGVMVFCCTSLLHQGLFHMLILVTAKCRQKYIYYFVVVYCLLLFIFIFR